MNEASYDPNPKEPDFGEPPRRLRRDLWTPCEYAIALAIGMVEGAGTDPRLTDAVILLGRAKDRVADYVDGIVPGSMVFGHKGDKMSEERERAEANELREYLRLPGGGVSTRALVALAMQDKGASTYDLEYAEALLRSNGWLPPEERATEHEIHGLCPGHPIANDPAATCSVCNMSRETLNELIALLIHRGAPKTEGEPR